jgi:hypothetical protein
VHVKATYEPPYLPTAHRIITCSSGLSHDRSLDNFTLGNVISHASRPRNPRWDISAIGHSGGGSQSVRLQEFASCAYSAICTNASPRAH